MEYPAPCPFFRIWRLSCAAGVCYNFTNDEQAVIRIIDNGIGISKQDLPRVFERFDRINEAGVRGEAALGLGLPLTRQFLEAHGGSVELESKKGKGTIVTLTIPRGTK